MKMVFLVIVIHFECQMLQISFWYCLNSRLIKAVLRSLLLTFDTKRKAHLFENYNLDIQYLSS